MVIDGDDDELFVLGPPPPTAPVSRTTLLRQVLAGVALILAAAGAAWLLPTVLSDGPLQSDETVVPADGTAYDADTSSDRTSMLWFDGSLDDPSCEVRDGGSDEVLDLTRADRTERRFGAPVGDWVGVATFEPVSDSVRVTCSEAPGSAVLVSQAPSSAPGLLALGAIIVVPLTLALMGLVLMVAVATSLVQARAAARA